MKNIYLLLLFIATFGYAQQQPFITTWESTPGIYLYAYGENLLFDFGDGTVTTFEDSLIYHTFATSGLHTVTIYGNLHSIEINSTLLKSIDQWGDSEWVNLHMAFYGCSNMTINATDVPNLSQATDLSQMFYGCATFNSNINNWDTSNVTNMSGMFGFCYEFNQPLDNWNVGNVTNMREMFHTCFAFNQPLNSWDVSNVTDTNRMIYDAQSFNQPLDNWNVSSIISMSSMFGNAESFSQPLNNWNVSNVTDMSGMFSQAESFNQPLNNWDVNNVTDMMSMFDSAESFNQDLSAWDFSAVEGYIGFGGSGLDTNNYDALLNRFAQLEISNISMSSYNLHYCNAGVRNYLIENLGWTIIGDSLGEECQGNNVTGTMLIDTDLNGCDATDAPAVNFMVQATNGTYNYGTFVNNIGNYDLRVEEDTYTVAPVNVPDYFTVTPASAEVSFTGFGNSEMLNFCLVPNQSVQDVNVTVLPIGDARPGFESEYKILIENIGTQSVTNASVSLSFDNTLQSFVSAIPAPATTSANQLTFNVGNLGVFETKEVNLTMSTFQPPVVNGGEVATFTANVTPDAGDNTPLDNTFTLN